ncbi:hypothetical protein EDD36DRAFT_381448 [Exophiala viscosa]|uniref:Polycomb protein VEFS-Box domain-containing protein n=1 Tax=Exophiala viscosa TaxID=2486360 RepID=A0AAN6E1M6_9EURO|nr:hypothetical protein EDD36DRAFT_381448 [Exophiala viscosa]
MLNFVYSSNSSRPERRFSRHLIGDFTFALQRSQSRHKLFLERNIARVLDDHQQRREGKSRAAVSRKTTSPNSLRVGTTTTEGLESRGAVAEQAVGASPLQGSTASGRLTSNSRQTQVQPNMARSSLSAPADGKRTERKTRRSIRGLLDKVYEQPDAEISLDLINIRKKLNFKTNSVEELGRPAKRQKRDTVKCQCYLTVWDNRDGYTTAPLVSKSEYCHVTATETTVNGYFVELSLDRPFTVKAHDLKVSVPSRNGEEAFALIDKYFLELKIIPCRNDSRWPPVPILGKSDGDHFAPDIKRNGAELLQGAIVARYTHLPQPPEEDTPLSVFFLHEGRTYRTKYGLQVSSTWQKSGERPKTARREGQGLDLDSFRPQAEVEAVKGANGTEAVPTVADSQKVAETVQSNPPEVCYNFCSTVDQKFRYATVKGYRCPLCAIWKTSKLHRLQFHLSTMHSKYMFSLQKPRRDPVSHDLTHIQIKVDLAPPVKKEEDVKTFEWHAPASPFDLSAYTEGDRGWVGSANIKASPGEETASTALPSTENPPSGFLPAVRVSDFRQPKRRKYKAIQLRPDFADPEPVYTSISHRPVSPSEEPRSETDDEIDNQWQIDLHMERLDLVAKRKGWTDHERELSKRWDKHRMEEQLEHSRYLSNSLIRFVRKNRKWLKNGNDELLQVFCDFLERLKERDVIDDNVVCDVNLLIFRDSPEPALTKKQPIERSESPMTRQRRREGLSGTAEPWRRETPRPVASIAVSMQPPRPVQRSTESVCGLCSEPIARAIKNGVMCADPECTTPRAMYHRSCAEQQQELVSGHGHRKMDKGKAPATAIVTLPVPTRSAEEFERWDWSCQACVKRQKAGAKEKQAAISAAATAVMRDLAVT